MSIYFAYFEFICTPHFADEHDQHHGDRAGSPGHWDDRDPQPCGSEKSRDGGQPEALSRVSSH